MLLPFPRVRAFSFWLLVGVTGVTHKMSGSSCSSPASPEAFQWQSCLPEDGEELFVQALQLLGIDMAKALPRDIKDNVVVPLGAEPTGTLFIGDFKAKTKERNLNPGCNF